MLSKIYKIIFLFSLVIFCQNTSYSKNFNEKNVNNYFSALVALKNNNITESLNYFNSSNKIKESHSPYIKKHMFSLVLGEKVEKAIREIKITKNKKLVDFFEAKLLLVLDSIKKKNI